MELTTIAARPAEATREVAFDDPGRDPITSAATAETKSSGVGGGEARGWADRSGKTWYVGASQRGLPPHEPGSVSSHGRSVPLQGAAEGSSAEIDEAMVDSKGQLGPPTIETERNRRMRDPDSPHHEFPRFTVEEVHRLQKAKHFIQQANMRISRVSQGEGQSGEMCRRV